MPKGKYKGQKLIKLVAKNTNANTPKTIAVVPVITFVAYSIPTNAANTILKTLSAEPMFFFIIVILGRYLYLKID